MIMRIASDYISLKNFTSTTKVVWLMDDTPVVSEQDILKIADMCPRAMPAYFICVRNSDEYGDATIPKKHIVNDLARSWTKFRNDLRSLMSIGILEVFDYEDGVETELLGRQYDRGVL